MKTSESVLKELDRLLNDYKKEVEKAREGGLVSEKTAKTYTYHLENFVRWVNGDFIPGEKNR